MPRRLATALLLCWIAGYVTAQVQVRVDDDDPAIEYSPVGSWFRSEAPNPMAAGGFHQVTTSAGASATFRFTGTGISYMAPLFAEEITTQVRLDGGVPILINLQDTTVPAEVDGATTVESSVLWSENGLTNTEHTLVIDIAPGGRFAVVDMLIVEQDGTTTDTSTDTSTETEATPTTVDDTTTSSSTRTRAAAATSPTASPTPGTTAGLTITIAVVCSVFGLLFIIGLLLFLARRRRQRREREAWNQMNPPTNDSPPLDTVDDGINAPPKQRFRSIPSRNSKYYDESPDSMSQVTTTMASGKAASKLRQVVATEDGRRQSWVPPVLPPKNSGYEIVETSRT